MEGLDSTEGIVAVAAAGVALLALIVALVAVRRLRSLAASQREVLGEYGRGDLVAHGVETRHRVDEVASMVEETMAQLNARTETVEERLAGSVSRAAVLRYDASPNETSGRQSSSVALFNEYGDGVVISAIQQREQARIYAKPIKGGRSEFELSPEEQEAIRVAQEDARS